VGIAQAKGQLGGFNDAVNGVGVVGSAMFRRSVMPSIASETSPCVGGAWLKISPC
jgi:hypothetical protein